MSRQVLLRHYSATKFGFYAKFTTAELHRNLQISTLVGTQILKKLLPFNILLEKTARIESVRI
jgi:hypothetical protein